MGFLSVLYVQQLAPCPRRLLGIPPRSHAPTIRASESGVSGAVDVGRLVRATLHRDRKASIGFGSPNRTHIPSGVDALSVRGRSVVIVPLSHEAIHHPEILEILYPFRY